MCCYVCLWCVAVSLSARQYRGEQLSSLKSPRESHFRIPLGVSVCVYASVCVLLSVCLFVCVCVSIYPHRKPGFRSPQKRSLESLNKTRMRLKIVLQIEDVFRPNLAAASVRASPPPLRAT